MNPNTFAGHPLGAEQPHGDTATHPLGRAAAIALNRAPVPTEVEQGLAAGRRRALAIHRARAARPRPLAWLRDQCGLLVPILMLVLAFIVFTDMLPGPNAREDAALLTGDLPLHAYLDQDFSSWLNESSSH